ncbi:hypothetical protein C8R44DRAFT_746764 [Mycena epipterygia]|nr:hypothetical protein C8R44DRAFT_746764 [Mycena epipterygia]
MTTVKFKGGDGPATVTGHPGHRRRDEGRRDRDRRQFGRPSAQWTHITEVGLSDKKEHSISVKRVVRSRRNEAAYYWLVQMHAEIEKHRKQFTFDTLAVVNDPDCDKMANCAVARNTEWTLTVPRLMHHPDVPIPCIELLNMLDDAVIEGLCNGCQKRTVRWLWGTGHVTKEQTLVDKAIAKLMALQTDEPICAALRDNVQY